MGRMVVHDFPNEELLRVGVLEVVLNLVGASKQLFFK